MKTLKTLVISTLEERRKRGDLIYIYKLTKDHESLHWENNTLTIDRETIKPIFKEKSSVLKEKLFLQSGHFKILFLLQQSGTRL